MRTTAQALRRAGPAHRWIAALATALALTACGDPTPDESLAAARQALAQRDTAGAELWLKSVLDAEPNSGEARLLLGQTLLEAGNAAGAEIELRRALSNGRGLDAVGPSLARSLLLQGKDAVLAQMFEKKLPPSGPAAAMVLTSLAEAALRRSDFAAAMQHAADALRRAPGHLPAQLMQARVHAAAGRPEQAAPLVDALLARQPRLAEAWLLRGNLLLDGQKDGAPALRAYRQAASLDPALAEAHAAIINLALLRGDEAGASAQWTEMHKALPRHGRTVYYEAMLALRRGEAQRSVELCRRLLLAAPDSVEVLVLIGQAELQLQAFAQAITHLGKATQLAPQQIRPRQLLARSHLRAKQPDKALESLRPLLDGASPDAESLLIAGQAMLETGDLRQADKLLARADALRPDDAGIRAALALSRIAAGDAASGLAQLQAIAVTDKGTGADLALINLHLQRKSYEPALQAIDRLAAKQPTSPLSDELRGRVLLQRGDATGARIAFEAALAKDAGHFPAIGMLAALDLGERRPQAAQQRFAELLRRNPADARALVAVAELKARSGARPQEVTDLLTAAVKSDGTDPRVRGLLVEQLVRLGQTGAALAEAQAAAAAFPDRLELQVLLGRTQLAEGSLTQGLDTFRRLAKAQPRSAELQLQLAEAAARAGVPGDRASAVRRAYALAPEQLPVQQAALALAMDEQRPGQALAIARAVQARRADEAIGSLLEGEVEMGQAHWDAAAAAFRKGLGKRHPGALPARLHNALTLAQRKDEAEQFAQAWLRDHAEDADFLRYLGDAAAVDSRWAEAEARYRSLLDQRPDDVQGLNNLAITLIRQNKPGATAAAEAAVRQTGEQPALMETLARSHAQQGQWQKAISLQSRVVELAPDMGQYRLTLADLQLRAGDKEGARIQLDQLGQSGSALLDQEEVDRLRRQIGSAPGRQVTAAVRSGLPARPRMAWARFGTVALWSGAVLGLGLLLVPLVAALRPAYFVVKRSIAIDAPLPRVFDLLQDLRQWERWSAWPQFGPTVTRRFNRTTAGRGAYCTWHDPRQHADGSIEILALEAPNTLVLELGFVRPREFSHLSEFTLRPGPAGATVVDWVCRGPAPFGMRALGVLYSIDRRIGKSLRANLQGLQAAASAEPGPAPTALETPLAA